jgi:hypothetical protein
MQLVRIPMILNRWDRVLVLQIKRAIGIYRRIAATVLYLISGNINHTTRAIKREIPTTIVITYFLCAGLLAFM